MFSPVLIWFLLFYYGPMYGLQIAFREFTFKEGIWGSPWIGFDNFRALFSGTYFPEALRNTLMLSFMRMFFGFPVPIIFALLLNEIIHSAFKRIVQSISYLPRFMSWVVIAGLFYNILSPSRGVLAFTGIDFLMDPRFFRWTLILADNWAGTGWASIIYLAAITGIDPALYECAALEGAKKFKMMWYITIPMILPVISIMFIMHLGSFLTYSFELVFNMQNDLVLSVSETIDTYAYKIGLAGGRYSFGTAVGLFQSVIGCILVIGANMIVRRIDDGANALF